jgi:hypothetical protein
MNIFRLLTPSLLAAVLLSSCATLYSGRRDYMHIASYPQSATVKINGKAVGTTPLTFTAVRSLKPQKVSVELPGYNEKTFTLSRTLNPWAIIDFPTIIGGAADLASGAVFRYRPRFYEIPLIKNGKAEEKQKHYNRNDNFFIETTDGTVFYCKPRLADFIAIPAFEGLNNQSIGLDLGDIQRFKVIKPEISALLILKLRSRFYEAVYERHSITPQTPSGNDAFMEVLLKNDEYRLVAFNRNRIIPAVPFLVTYGKTLRYYIFNGDSFVKELTRKNYEQEILQFFPDDADVKERINAGKLSYKDLQNLGEGRKIKF